MINFKKISTLLCVLCLSFSLTACMDSGIAYDKEKPETFFAMFESLETEEEKERFNESIKRIQRLAKVQGKNNDGFMMMLDGKTVKEINKWAERL